jgi:caffeoyl-CoA O-methyltransferase
MRKGKLMDQNQYIRGLFVKEDEYFASISTALSELQLPLISVPPEVGKVLTLLVKMSQATKVLEVGTLAGYSTICLMRGLNETGHCTTIELKEEHAQLASQYIAQAGFADRVSILIGDASNQLASLIEEQEQFDFFFIDADKVNYPIYLQQILQLAVPGAIIVFDNLFLGGRVLDTSDQNPAPVAVRQVTEMLANHPRLESMLLPIGDGLGVAIVR